MIEVLYTAAKIIFLIAIVAKIFFLWFLIIRSGQIKKYLKNLENICVTLRNSIMTKALIAPLGLALAAKPIGKMPLFDFLRAFTEILETLKVIKDSPIFSKEK